MMEISTQNVFVEFDEAPVRVGKVAVSALTPFGVVEEGCGRKRELTLFGLNDNHRFCSRKTN